MSMWAPATTRGGYRYILSTADASSCRSGQYYAYTNHTVLMKGVYYSYYSENTAYVAC